VSTVKTYRGGEAQWGHKQLYTYCNCATGGNKMSVHCCFNPGEKRPVLMAGPQHKSGSSDEGKNPGWKTAHLDPSDSKVNGARGGMEALTKEAIPKVKQPPRYHIDSKLNGRYYSFRESNQSSSPKPFAVTAAPQFTAVFAVI